MAVEEHPSGFGKRAVHRVWSDRLPQAEVISFSQTRGWTAVVVLSLLAVFSLSAAIAVGTGRLPAVAASIPDHPLWLIGAAAACAPGVASLWVASRVGQALLRPGPALRLDPSRIVLRTRAGHLMLAWQDVELSPGRILLRIRVQPSSPTGARSAAAEEILVPTVLLRGGAGALRVALGRVRPGVAKSDRAGLAAA